MADFNFSITNIMNESWQCNNIYIDINGVRVNQGYMVEYKMNWHGPIAKGKLVIYDFKGFDRNVLFQKKKDPGDVWGQVKIAFTSQEISRIGPALPFQESFIITNAYQTIDRNDKGLPMIVMELTHRFNVMLGRTYKSVAVENKPVNEVFKTILDESKLGYKVGIFSAAKEDPMEYVITPSNVSMDYVLGNMMKETGYALSVDKDNVTIMQKELLNPKYSVDTGEKFLYQPERKYAHTRFQILEFNVNGFNGWATENATPAAVTKISNQPTNEKGTDMAAQAAGPAAGKKIGAAESDKIASYVGGWKVSEEFRKGQIGSEVNYNQTAEIFIPGRNGSWLNRTITAELPRTKQEMQDGNSEAYTGKWIVYGYTDYIIQSYFFQKLLLRRAGD